MARRRAKRDLNPVGAYQTAFDWSGTSGRGVFAAFSVPFAAAVIAVGSLPPLSGAQAACAVLAALLFPAATGHALRRLNALGWPTATIWLLLVPLLSLLLWAALIVLPKRRLHRAPQDSPLRGFGYAAVLFGTLLILSRAFWHPFLISDGAMKPGLIPGDYMLAGRLHGAVDRGDVIVFATPSGAQIKRVIGLPGDTVQLRDGLAYLNGTALPQAEAGIWSEIAAPQGPRSVTPRCGNDPVGLGGSCLTAQKRETYPEGRSALLLDLGPTPLDHTVRHQVPPQSYFLLGDHRDISADSRIPAAAGGLGMLPQNALIGKARLVLFSSESSWLWAFWTWRPNRFLKAIR